MKARLYIKGNVGTETGFVTSFSLPPFNRFPDVLVWGSRIFTFFGHAEPLAEEQTGWYVEAFAYHISIQG